MVELRVATEVVWRKILSDAHQKERKLQPVEAAIERAKMVAAEGPECISDLHMLSQSGLLQIRGYNPVIKKEQGQIEWKTAPAQLLYGAVPCIGDELKIRLAETLATASNPGMWPFGNFW